jgi:hypothetical protein
MDWDGNGQLICVDLSGDWPLGKGRQGDEEDEEERVVKKGKSNAEVAMHAK